MIENIQHHVDTEDDAQEDEDGCWTYLAARGIRALGDRF